MTTDQLTDMTRKDLAEVMRRRGLPVRSKMTRGAMIAALLEDAPDGTESEGETAHGETPVNETSGPQDGAHEATDVFLTVRGCGPQNRVAFFERNAAHPDGEVFLTGGRVGQVGETRAVLAAVASGRLVREDGA